MESETFSLARFLAMGLQKRAHFYKNILLPPVPGITIYNLVILKRKKPSAPTLFFVPDEYNFILVHCKTQTGALVIRRKDILKLRKNNRIKSTYRKLRAIKPLQP